MSLDRSYLRYPSRAYGMDHNRYAWSILQHRPPVRWPDGKRVALWITVPVEIFPLDDVGKPFKLPGAMRKPYPDVQTFTWRDYGNRVGIYRMMRAFDRVGVVASWAINGSVATIYPGLLRDIAARGEEIIAHGWDMASPHYQGIEEADEARHIERSLAALEKYSKEPIRGWMSPGKSQSARTPDLLAAAGLSYMCDWPNDDLPYRFRTTTGELIAMPHSDEMDDRQVISDYKHDENSFIEQVTDQYLWLCREALETKGGRVLSLTLHPWMVGQSSRIAHLEKLLVFLMQQPDIWATSGSCILDCWQAAQSD